MAWNKPEICIAEAVRHNFLYDLCIKFSVRSSQGLVSPIVKLEFSWLVCLLLLPFPSDNAEKVPRRQSCLYFLSLLSDFQHFNEPFKKLVFVFAISYQCS